MYSQYENYKFIICITSPIIIISIISYEYSHKKYSVSI